jgi:hypothetical protein
MPFWLVSANAMSYKWSLSVRSAVNQLDRSKVYSIKKDGLLVGYLKKGAIVAIKGAKGIEFSKEGILKISTDLAKAQTFLIQAEKAI